MRLETKVECSDEKRTRRWCCRLYTWRLQPVLDEPCSLSSQVSDLLFTFS
ncbi:hypothetical protein ES702_00180 [subsurface metagenome]